MAALQSLPETAPAVNPLHLSDSLRATYDLVCALARRTGACYARASWLASRLGVSESQLSRRLKRLASFGLLAIEHVQGLKRLLRPIRADSPTSQTHLVKKPTTGSVGAANDDAPPVVASLCRHGLTYQTARDLAERCFDECKRQLATFSPVGKRNPGGWLRRAIENGWSVGNGQGDSACGGKMPLYRVRTDGEAAVFSTACDVPPPMEWLRGRVKNP